MKPACPSLRWALVGVLAASLWGCAGVVPAPQLSSLQARAGRLEPGKVSAAEVEVLLGPPRTVTSFIQGHRVWQYYAPKDGASLSSLLPLVDVMSAERGRAAREVVLLFDRDGILRQVLVRDLPGDGALRSN